MNIFEFGQVVQEISFKTFLFLAHLAISISGAEALYVQLW